VEGKIFTSVMEVIIEESRDSFTVPLLSNGQVIAGAVILDTGKSASARARLYPRDRRGEKAAEGSWQIWEDAGMEIYIEIPEKNNSPGPEEIAWAVIFGETEKELERNIRSAVKTYLGARTDDGMITRWVVPARKLKVIQLDSRYITSWNEGKGERGLAVEIPLELSGKSVKWIRLNGRGTGEYTRTGKSLLIDPPPDSAERPVEIEGQFSDGSLFRSLAGPANTGGSEDREERSMLPESFVKLYPNPFVDNVNITLQITRTDDIMAGRDNNSVLGGSSSVRIYDVRGELVKTVLRRDFLPPGSYTYNWDGTDRRKQKVAPGVYYCTLKIGERSRTKRVILLK
jgi:hypothetical protein